MSFAENFKNESNLITTENGMVVKSTTGSALLNLFARVGGLREADENEIVRLYLDARNEDKELADNLILYARNIRDGGLGERRIARILLKTLAAIDPPKVARNFETIVTTGRWDDLFIFEGTALETAMMEFIHAQLNQDLVDMKNSQAVSLLAKWMPSSNASSKETRRLARKFYTFMGINERAYRKILSTLRRYLSIVERQMSANKFGLINYECVPSKAINNYKNAFQRHDEERFGQYLSDVYEGKAKINAGTLYPYDVIKSYLSDNIWTGPCVDEVDPVVEAQWKALPNYVEGEHNVIVMADVSGSMEGRPMETSIGLGIYFAERNTGAYQNLVMTFTDRPSLFELDPNSTLLTRAQEVSEHTGYNTNLDIALEKIYNIAKKSNEAPEALVVISDGEFDDYCSSNPVDSIVEKWQKEYEAIGLAAPKIISWNVASRGDRYIESMANAGISYVSGSSAGTFKELTALITKSAYDAMVDILSKTVFCWR